MRQSIILGGLLVVALGLQSARGDDDAVGEPIDADSRAEVLGFLSKQISENYQRLKTWSGEFTWKGTTMFSIPPALQNEADDGLIAEMQINQAVVSVHRDFEFDRLRSDWKQSGPAERYHLNPKVGTRVNKGGNAKLYEYRYIVSPECLLSFSPTENIGQLKDWPEVDGVGPLGGRIAYRKPSRAVVDEREFGKFVDPRDLFGARDRLFFDFCELYRSALEGERTAREKTAAERNMHIRRFADGASTKYVCTVDYPNASGGLLLRTETVFAADAGYNVTSWRQIGPDDKVEYVRKFEFRTIDEIIVPSRMTYEQFGKSEQLAGMPAKRIELVLKSVELNKELDGDRFNMTDLGLKYGDRLLDELSKQLLVKDGKRFVRAIDFVFEAPD